MSAPAYTERLDAALALAADAFRDRRRKGSGIPYLTHLLQVMVTVGEHGGDEDQMVAALLHDYLEDIEGASRREVAERFGERVARMVEALSDAVDEHPKPPWRERKERYLARLGAEPHDVKLVCAADKLHNARSILRDFQALGEEVWERFNAGRPDILWYYRSVVSSLGEGWDHPLHDELARAVKDLHDATWSTLAD